MYSIIDKESVHSQSGTESIITTEYNEYNNKHQQKNKIQNKTRFVVLYGSEQFYLHFPFISPLFCKSFDYSIPGSYITLSDGSNFYAAKNICFILCLPTSSVKKKFFFYILIYYLKKN